MQPLARHPFVDRPLRIGMLAPIAWRVPPRHYGPWERVVSLLTESLVSAGVDVTLFATADSITGASLSAVVPRPYEESPGMDVKVWECLHLLNAFGRSAEFDLIHNHYDFLPLAFASFVKTPTLTTVHGFSGLDTISVYAALDRQMHYVSISKSDHNASLSYVATIYHGLDFDEFTFQPQSGEYLVFLGRLHPDKGACDAIRVAQAVGMPLVLAGIIQDQAYFACHVEPYLSETIQYIGPVGPSQLDKLLGGARALLHLIHFEEPFGLSVVEAMACGTPVIAYARGSMPELIDNGVSGLLVSDERDAIKAVELVGLLDRNAIRRHAEKFSLERMTDAYLLAYHSILGLPALGGATPRQVPPI